MSVMSDKELLELAARAAGIEGAWTDSGCDDRGNDTGLLLAGNTNYIWNPLADDGDALRLAVKLKIDIHQRVVEPRVAAIAAMQSPKIESVADEKHRLAATRRAIVRAAAALVKENRND